MANRRAWRRTKTKLTQGCQKRQVWSVSFATEAPTRRQNMNKIASSLNWFEIPVTDMIRAVAFYEGMLGRKLNQSSFGGVAHAMFPTGDAGAGYDPNAITGALVQQGKPGESGVRIYLNVDGVLDACLER